MMKKILVLGSKGMAGHVVKMYLQSSNLYQVHDVARDSKLFAPTFTIDVFDTNALKNVIEKEKYDVVINCIGSLNRDAEENPDKAVFLNSYLPHFVAKHVNVHNGKLIHISTDCVFSGKKGGYIENDVKDGKGYYAQSKALGEIEDEVNLTLRTSIIGPELKSGIGLFHWFMTQSKSVKGYERAWWSGVTTIQLAKSIHDILQNNDITGLYHLTNNDKINKYSLLNMIKETFRKEIMVDKDPNYVVDKSLIDTRATLTTSIPSYQQMIIEMKEWMTSLPEYYSQYRS